MANVACVKQCVHYWTNEKKYLDLEEIYIMYKYARNGPVDGLSRDYAGRLPCDESVRSGSSKS